MPDAWLPILLTAFFSGLVLFLAWGGRLLVSMSGRLIGIERDIASLLGTRTDQKAEKLAGTEKRLDALERGR